MWNLYITKTISSKFLLGVSVEMDSIGTFRMHSSIHCWRSPRYLCPHLSVTTMAICQRTSFGQIFDEKNLQIFFLIRSNSSSFLCPLGRFHSIRHAANSLESSCAPPPVLVASRRQLACYHWFLLPRPVAHALVCHRSPSVPAATRRHLRTRCWSAVVGLWWTGRAEPTCAHADRAARGCRCLEELAHDNGWMTSASLGGDRGRRQKWWTLVQWTASHWDLKLLVSWISLD
jgi:hypothetical protein